MRMPIVHLISLGIAIIVCTDAAANSKKKTESNKAIRVLNDYGLLVQHSQSALLNDGRLEGVEFFSGDLAKLENGLELKAVWKDPSKESSAPIEIAVVIEGMIEDKLAGDKKNISPRPYIFYPMLTKIGDFKLPAKINLCERQYVPPYSKAEKEKSNKNDLKALHKRAVAVAGYWDRKTGAYVSDPAGKKFTISCLSGIVAKCAHWGYVPNAEFIKNAIKIPLTPYHEACVRAARAMYDPTSLRSYTCRSTVIDIYDNLGIKESDRTADLQFEGVWIKNGDRVEMKLVAQRFQENCSSEPVPLCSPADMCKDPHLEGWGKGIVAVRSDLENNQSSSGECPGKLINERDPCD